MFGFLSQVATVKENSSFNSWLETANNLIFVHGVSFSFEKCRAMIPFMIHYLPFSIPNLLMLTLYILKQWALLPRKDLNSSQLLPRVLRLKGNPLGKMRVTIFLLERQKPICKVSSTLRVLFIASSFFLRLYTLFIIRIADKGIWKGAVELAWMVYQNLKIAQIGPPICAFFNLLCRSSLLITSF